MLPRQSRLVSVLPCSMRVEDISEDLVVETARPETSASQKAGRKYLHGGGAKAYSNEDSQWSRSQPNSSVRVIVGGRWRNCRRKVTTQRAGELHAGGGTPPAWLAKAAKGNGVCSHLETPVAIMRGRGMPLWAAEMHELVAGVARAWALPRCGDPIPTRGA